MSAKKTLCIGLTGTIGAGKSLALNILRTHKVPVLEADRVGHEILYDPKMRKVLLKTFGSKILNSRGGIDRSSLAKQVFHHRNLRVRLNKIMHPVIWRKIEEWITLKKKLGSSMIVIEVPLLFEGHFQDRFDHVLSISAPFDLRKKRVVKKGWTAQAFKIREKFQWSQTKKNQNATWVLYNNGTPAQFEIKVLEWLHKMKYGFS